MRTGPDIARLAALIGDPARAQMLTALMDREALTAGELAAEAGVALPTASGHLAKLRDGGLVSVRQQGRHRYFALSGQDVAGALEVLMGVAARTGRQRTRPGPREPELRLARVCYDHLAGDLGVAMLDGLEAKALLADWKPTAEGEAFLAEFGVDLTPLRALRRPLCRACLDWSVRRPHLAGALGAALLERIYARGWATRIEGSRVVRFTPKGLEQFRDAFAFPRFPGEGPGPAQPPAKAGG